jgi:hypothetical protein
MKWATHDTGAKHPAAILVNQNEKNLAQTAPEKESARPPGKDLWSTARLETSHKGRGAHRFGAVEENVE